MSPARLDVFLHGDRIGALSRLPDGGYGFAYAPEVVDRCGEGSVLLSHSLPVRAQAFDHSEARPYFAGLLPDGPRRERIARELSLDPADDLGLLAELGGDCLGAVLVLPEGEAPVADDSGDLVGIADEELEELLDPSPGPLFDPDQPQRMRFALPGKRHKLALVRDEENDRWAWPTPGMPSTHIVKPESDTHPDLVANQMLCALLLFEIGMPIAHFEMRPIAGRRCLVSKRFDRWGEGASVTRLHQETIWQTLGLAPGAEQAEEEADRPGFFHSRELLQRIGEDKSIDTLFSFGFCNFLLGNDSDAIIHREDLHGRKWGVLFGDEGPLPAPLCGVISTDVYDDRPPASTLVEFVERTSTWLGVVRIGMECGYEPQPALFAAMETTGRLLDALKVIIDRADEEGWYVPLMDEIAALVVKRFKRLCEELQFIVRGPNGEKLPPLPPF